MFNYNYSSLLTDLYELTMMAGYFKEGMHEKEAVFDLFFRQNPFQGTYAVFAGLEPALKYISQLRFGSADINYLRSLNIFQENFLDYLADFQFRARITAPLEGTVVFANEPLLTVEGHLAEVQLVETALLNIINFQTLVATKAARIKSVAGKSVVLEFGLRRAHGPDGGLGGARAAYIGGGKEHQQCLGRPSVRNSGQGYSCPQLDHVLPPRTHSFQSLRRMLSQQQYSPDRHLRYSQKRSSERSYRCP